MGKKVKDIVKTIEKEEHENRELEWDWDNKITFKK